MKTRFALLVSVVLVMAGAVWLAVRTLPPPAVAMHLHSDPFPLNVGSTTLRISLAGADGTPVDGAVVQVAAHMNHPGMPTIVSQPAQAAAGEYRVPVIWPMAGEWTLDIVADLPDQAAPMQEQYSVYVYPMAPYGSIAPARYRSQSEISAAASANQAREFWIMIPQGTKQMLISGVDHDIIPDEIRLQTSGRNVLVIRNDDIADHTIGPFFVRAGETIRQTFTQPAVFQGTCSIKHSDEIRIIVEA